MPSLSRPSSNRSTRLALLVLVLLVVLARSGGLTRPLLGNFATKNVVYGMIARNWALGEAPARLPTLDCLVNGQRSLHLLEFPISTYLTAGLWSVFGGELDVWGRLTSVAFSAASVVLLFLLVRRWHGVAAAWGASLVLALSPVSIIYGQSFMLESSLVCFTLATLWCWEKWRRQDQAVWAVAAAGALALLLLTKVYMLVLLPALLVMMLRREDNEANGDVSQQRIGGRRLAVGLAALGVAVVPAALWCWQVLQATSPGNPLAERLFYSMRQSAAVHRLPHPLLFSPEFYANVMGDLATTALTPLGLVLALFGLAHPAWRRHLPWLISMGILLLALPLKFHEMNYYYLVILPPLCVMAGLGWRVIHQRLQPSRGVIAVLIIVGVMFSARYAAKPAFVTPLEDRSVLAAAQATRELTSADEPVATMHGSTIDLLYYCNRRGWALSPGKKNLPELLNDCRNQGARYLVVAAHDRLGKTAMATLKQYPVVRQGDGFRIYGLSVDAEVADARRDLSRPRLSRPRLSRPR